MLGRASKREEQESRPCRKFHVIAVNKAGIFSKMLYFTNPDIVTTIFDLNDDANHSANLLMKTKIMIKLMNLLLV